MGAQLAAAWGLALPRPSWREEAIAALCVAAMPVCAVLPTAALLLPPAQGAAAALRHARESSRTVRRVLDDAATTLPRGARLGEPRVDLAALADPAAREAASAATRAADLPSMEPRDLQEMFAVLGRDDLRVVAWPAAPGDTTRIDALLCLTGAQRDAVPDSGWVALGRYGSGPAGAAVLVPREDPARR